jgi:transposase-like protein
MKLVMTGGRDYNLTPEMKVRLAELIFDQGVTTTLDGDCPTGADRQMRAIAKEMGCTTLSFPAQWKRYGRNDGRKNPAGMVRNADMAEKCEPGVDGCVAMPGGPGTANMLRQAKKRGLKTWDWRDES